MGKARPIMTASPNAGDSGSKSSSEEVRKSIRSDARRLLGQFYKKVEGQRGLPKDRAKVRVR